MKATRAEINIDAIKHNFLYVKNSVKPGVKVCCVVKADAYGHGAVRLGKIYEEMGADFFAVSELYEAMQLRKSGIKLPILILGYTDPEMAKELYENDISQCVFSYEYGKMLADNAAKCGCKIKAHIKIDSGMGRIGFIIRGRKEENERSLSEIEKLAKEDNLIFEGIFTHFSVADEDDGADYTNFQYENFSFAVDELKKRGIDFKIRHCSNSASITNFKNMNFDMVRAGIVLYGYGVGEGLMPAMTLKTVISNIKTVEKGDSVGYGRTFIADKKMKIATLPIGYADGLFRANARNGLKINIGGKMCGMLGRVVCMDQIMVCADGVDCKPGDDAIIFGEGAYDAAEVAKLNETISYEILCAVSKRVTRVYFENGKKLYEDNCIFSEE